MGGGSSKDQATASAAAAAATGDKATGEAANGSASTDRSPHTTRSHLLRLSRAVNQYAMAQYQEFIRDGKRTGNVVFAPISLSVGLGMLYLGSKGATRDDICKVLCLHEMSERHLLAAYAALHWDVVRSATSRGCIYESAIRVFCPLYVKATPDYLNTLDSCEVTPLGAVDFQTRPDLARKEINRWTAEKSHRRILDVLPTGVIGRDTRLLLVAASYIKVRWRYAFDPKKTLTASFYLNHKETPKVLMMNQQQHYNCSFCAKVDSDVLELPFTNGYTKLYVFLPRKIEGIGKLERKISRDLIEGAISKMTYQHVDVYLPKFRYELGLPYKDMMTRVGIKHLFEYGRTNLAGIDGTRNLFVSRVFHHVFLEFDEGLASSACRSDQAHELDMDNGQTDRTFCADHPFMFIIIDERTGAILQMGRVLRPTLAY
ncbi:hypothetical protein NP493_1341g00000 [Ridgeia piscesae]|uniref:Serpin domain-containing protein n=1 Tax=Ridgeia piscesae TaxID=27915 RepID=A0AAD9K7B3_RIDPI|nr:hypothetical protein NP493_1341g00000 [Ridgeia piscesae]